MGVISAEVAFLTEGVMKTMLLTKNKFVTLFLLTAGLLGTDASWLTSEAAADGPDKTVRTKPDGDKNEPAKKANTEVSGVLQQVDLARSILVLATKELGPATLIIAKDAKVVVDDGTGDKFGFRDGKLADLTEGLAVIVRLTPDREKVIAVWIEGVTVQGVLKAVDAANDRITALVRGSKREPAVEKTFEVSPASRSRSSIVRKKGPDRDREARRPVGRRRGDLEALRRPKNVRTIWAQGQSLSGTLKAVDGAKNTITIVGREGDKTIELAKDVKVSIDDGKGDKAPPKQGKFADLTIGSMVTFRLSTGPEDGGGCSRGWRQHRRHSENRGCGQEHDHRNGHGERRARGGSHVCSRPDARIHIGGKLGKPHARRPAAGAQIAVKLSADMKTVVAIQGF